MQIPILNGIYTDEAGDFRSSYPRNLIPVPKENGISKGYLRPADGIIGIGEVVEAAEDPRGRGGIAWFGRVYRVIGPRFVRIEADGSYIVLGTVADNGSPVTMTYSFDRLAIASGGMLYYWDGSDLTRVTDTDLGLAFDVVWVDGYFMTTDGQYLVVTDLDDPTSVNPLKYGSSEADPDPIVGLLKLRNEIYALNRYTCELFNNVGIADGLFPFARIEGAQLQRGCIGTFCNCVFLDAGGNDAIAFLGGGRNEPPAIWLGASGVTAKISTQEIDKILKGYTEDVLKYVTMEAKIDESHQHLYLHLPDQTLVFDSAASQVVGEPVWFTLASSLAGPGQYRAQNFVWCFNQWNTDDSVSGQYGRLDNTIGSHYGEVVGWEFGTTIVYNESRGAIFHQVELVALTGRVVPGPLPSSRPTIWTSYSLDGETFSQERAIPAGTSGDRARRLVWFKQAGMRTTRVQHFRGTSDSHLTFARLEIELEALNA